MNIKLLDCTLRDGGYQNDWRFGYDNIRKIINLLIGSGVDIIECGFLTREIQYKRDVSIFNTIEQITDILPTKTRDDKMFVVMVNYGEFDGEALAECGGKIKGIRVAFHKRDIDGALDFCQIVQTKGYNTFVQAMVSMSYTDSEFLNLLTKVNKLRPHAFYIVDSFGAMKKRDLLRLFYMADNNLAPDIKLGFHSHNNMQLAYSNALALIEIHTNRELIIDASVHGMGRGAGNLNLELFAAHLNDDYNGNYQIAPLLGIIDDVLNGFYKQNPWGYSLPNYISAKYNAHPNYATYLDDRNTLTYEQFDEIIAMVGKEKKTSYDKLHIQDLYYRYMSQGESDETNNILLRTLIEGKELLVICPGKSIKAQSKLILEQSKKMVTISVNFDCTCANYIFVSNIKRYAQMDKNIKQKVIATTNVPAEGVFARIKYAEFLNDSESVQDNAGLMLIKFAISLGVSKIWLAGMDGYSHDMSENYGESQMEIVMRNAVMDAMNRGMREVVTQYAEQTEIEFLTTEQYVYIEKP